MNEALTQAVKTKLADLKIAFKDNEMSPYLSGSLYSGLPGVFLYKLYYQRAIDEYDEELEDSLIEFIEAELGKGILSTTFCNGIAGFAWFLYHLNSEGFIDLDEDLFADFDEVVYESSLADFENENHDFMHGSLGNFIYLIDRATTSENCKKYVVKLLSVLNDKADKTDKGTFWYESEIMLDEEQQGKAVVNLHLSHGQASKIMVLTNAVENGVEEAKPMLDETIKYLMNQKNDDQTVAILANTIVDDEKNEFSHMGWCRGNVSVSAVLLKAAKVLNDDELWKEAVEIGLLTLKLDDKEKARLTDNAICHGTSGISHMYNRLFVLTGEKEFQDAAEKWMQYTMDEIVFEDGIAGIKSWDSMASKRVNDYSLLSGAAGIGLTMISFISNENMNWDKCFLLS